MNEKIAKVWLRWYTSSEYQLPYVSSLVEVAEKIGITLSDADFDGLYRIRVWDDELVLPFKIPQEIEEKINTLIEILSEARLREYNLVRETLWKLLPEELHEKYNEFILSLIKKYGVVEKIEINQCCAMVYFKIGNTSEFIATSKEVAKELICK